MANTTLVTKSPGPLERLYHRPNCPASEGRLYGNPRTQQELDNNPRKALGIEAYLVTGMGKYNRMTGEHDGVPRLGVVRCLECAAELTIPSEDVAIAQQQIMAHTIPLETTHA